MGAEIVCTIEPAGGILGPPGYATSIALTDSRWYLREAYGYSYGGHDNVGRRDAINLERIPGYTRTGDGQQTVTGIGASWDGSRLLAGWKTSEHGTLIVENRSSVNKRVANGTVRGEFGGARQLGGVAVAVKGGRYYGFALSGFGLTMADITSPVPMQPGQRQPSQAVPGAPGGMGLVASGDTVAYIHGGDLVTFSPGGAPCVTSEHAVCVGMEGPGIVLGQVEGMTAPGGTYYHLGGFPSTVALLQSVPYAWVGPVLYREDVAILTMPSGIGTVVDMKGFGDRLYCATTDAVVVVRVS